MAYYKFSNQKKYLERSARFILIFLPLLVAAFQIYFSNFYRLTRWKGGGFGMYTSMHSNLRSLWITFPEKGGVRSIKIYPSKHIKDGNVIAFQHFIQPEIRKFMNFPDTTNIQFLLKGINQSGIFSHKLLPKKTALIVAEMSVDLEKRRISNKPIFRYEL